MSDFYIRQGDTASDIADVLRDANEQPVAVNGAAVDFVMSPLRGGPPKVDDDAQNDDDGSPANKGKVRYVWENAAQTDTPGDYLVGWKVTYASGKVQTFPNAGYLLLTITPKPGAALSYISLEEFKKTTKLTSITRADLDIEVAIVAAAHGLEETYGGPWAPGNPGEERYYTPAAGITHLRVNAVDDVTAVELDVAGNGAYDRTLVDGVDYRLEPVGAGPYTLLRFLRSGFAWSALDCMPLSPRDPYPWGLDALRITGTFGYAQVPEGVKAATTIIAARILRRMRESPFGGSIGFGLEGAVVRASTLAKDPEVAWAMKASKAPRRLVV